jgi:hypothetical protein
MVYGEWGTVNGESCFEYGKDNDHPDPKPNGINRS